MEKENVLVVNQMNKYYGLKQVLNDFSFELFQGEIVGLVGPNGSGKTTFFNCVLGLSSSTYKRLSIGEFDYTKNHYNYMKSLGVVFDTSHFYENMTGRENLKYHMDLFLLENGYDLINKYADEVGLGNRIDDKVKEYSYGMKKKLQIVKTLLIKPKVILMDEPFNGLDVETSVQLKHILKDLKEDGITVCISSHSLDELYRVCDRLIFIKNGSFVKEVNKGEKMLSDVTIFTDYVEEVEKIIAKWSQTPIIKTSTYVEFKCDTSKTNEVVELIAKNNIVYTKLQIRDSIEDLYFSIFGKKEESNHE